MSKTHYCIINQWSIKKYSQNYQIKIGWIVLVSWRCRHVGHCWAVLIALVIHVLQNKCPQLVECICWFACFICDSDSRQMGQCITFASSLGDDEGCGPGATSAGDEWTPYNSYSVGVSEIMLKIPFINTLPISEVSSSLNVNKYIKIGIILHYLFYLQMWSANFLVPDSL